MSKLIINVVKGAASPPTPSPEGEGGLKEDYDDAIKAEKETKRLTPIKKVREKLGI
jgi:hypothetical protein